MNSVCTTLLCKITLSCTITLHRILFTIYVEILQKLENCPKQKHKCSLILKFLYFSFHSKVWMIMTQQTPFSLFHQDIHSVKLTLNEPPRHFSNLPLKVKPYSTKRIMCPLSCCSTKFFLPIIWTPTIDIAEISFNSSTKWWVNIIYWSNMISPRISSISWCWPFQQCASQSVTFIQRITWSMSSCSSRFFLKTIWSATIDLIAFFPSTKW